MLHQIEIIRDNEK